MADLAKPEGRPAISVDGLLAALEVADRGSGLQWEGSARLIVKGMDVSTSMPAVSLPEEAFGGTSAAAVGVFSAQQVVAGARGCWATWVAGVAGLTVTRFDSEDAAVAAGNPSTLIGVEPSLYTLRGGVDSQILDVTHPNAGAVSVTLATLLVAATQFQLNAWTTPGLGVWCPPGSILRVSGSAVNTAVTLQWIVREPLAGP